jgi:hypothetical protein
MLYHKAVQYDSNGADVVAEYLSYRESAGVKALGVEVEPLYDLFGYGVDRHFVALRNYFAWLKKHAPAVEHVFLAGKGLDITHARRPEQWPQMETSFFIPVYGVPGSDQLLVSSNHQLDQWFPIGRLPVTRGDELRTYLEKVKAYESLQNVVQEERVRRGLKKVIHIHGGRNALEQSQLGGILDRMRGELERSAFAAEVYSFGKQSNEPVQGSAPEKIYQLINEGTGWISFLGHSGSTTLDFDIDNLALYTNRHRYPFFIALGCSVGNIFSPVQSFGERFNLISEKGTILFFATSGLGYPATLEGYARQIYSEVGESRQGVSFGQIVQKVHLANASTPNRLLQETIEQHVLNGDPSLKPHYAEKPDYVFDPESLRREPAEITVQDDSVIFNVDLLNVGKNQKDTASIGYTLLYPDGRQVSGTKDSLPLEAFRNPATLKLGLSEKAISGTYTLTMRIDPDQVLSEGPLPDALNNNAFRNPSGNAGIRFFVGDPQVRLLYPPDLYITGNDTIRLYAQSGNMSREPQGYKIQVDTTPAFLSPKEIQVNVPANSSQINAVFDVAGYPDSTTFFWRAVESGSDTVPVGRAFSFTRIKGGGSGLGMFTEEQFTRGTPLSMRVDSTGRWKHAQVDRQYLIRNSIFLNSGYPSGFYDGQRINSFFPFVSVLEGVGVVVLSPETGYRWSNPSPGRFGSVNSSGVASVCFPYPTRQPAARAALMTFLKDSIPSGATVLMYSLLRTSQSNYGAEDWAQDSVSTGQNLFQVLEQEGFDRIRELADAPGHSFILSYTKGAGPIDFRLAVQPTDTLISTGVVAESLPEGQYEWASHALQNVQRVFWSGQEPEERVMASQQIDFRNSPSPPRSWTAASGDQAWAPENADTLRLSLRSENQALAAFQLANWGFYGTQKPDLCWSGLDLRISSDTLLQGAPLSFEAEIVNLSAETCPPFTVWLQILDQQNNVHTDTLQLDSLLPFEDVRISHTFRQSAVSTGLNRLLLTLNPENTFGEISIENNGLEKSIFIQADQAGPVLDIWVDGRRILDGDLVSARPEIEIRLQDSHPILLLDNPEMIKIQWIRPGSQGVEDIPVASPGISFFPAEPGGKNEARLIYRPEQLEDGIHQLLVQGYDTQGNPAGRDPWRIRFQVINQAAISALANYPNPFSTSTRFVYTLSGQASPSAYHIRIYTVSGQLVREIQQWELGPLKVGKHLTDYAWDGRDQYGNLLANGVYLYRLELSDTDREEVQSMETRLDNFTTAGWSKMVILR